ncbi:MAG: twin-arginine translocase TatA/TatE family subunit [Chloroflexota bacterium]|nr:MAG: twin-arginine translocase TatA/TatE family subunit [Chloroflexota bacterium]
MPSIGPEWIIVLIVALLVLGPKRLPEVGSALGKTIREFRQGMTEVKDATSLSQPNATTVPPAAAPAAPVLGAQAAPGMQPSPPAAAPGGEAVPVQGTVAPAAGIALSAAPLPGTPEPVASGVAADSTHESGSAA